MKHFPDESQMARSKDGSEPIRGGSIGLNRILNTLVEASNTDKRPRFSAVLLSAFTIFRNVWEMESFPTIDNIEKGFVTDLNLFLDYLDTYFSHVLNHQSGNKRYCPVIVYFPDYHRLPKELEREQSVKKGMMMDVYKIFLNRHHSETGLVKTLDHVHCFFITAGHASYPHKEAMLKFRDITSRRDSLYTSGDPVAITTSIPLDLHLSYRLRNLHLLESNTGRIRPASEFMYKIDKEGRVPFQSAIHAVLGDDKLIKPQVPAKLRRHILEVAGEEKWATRGEEDVIVRLSKLADIPLAKLKQYDFT